MMRNLLVNIRRLLTSYGLACVVLILLCLLTLLGTLEQTRLGLYDTQKKYFDSLFLVHYLFGRIPIPLPGVYLLLALLSVNLLLGTFYRLRRAWDNAGQFAIHGGIILLLLGGMITHHLSESGHMTLDEGETSSEFQSYHEWELAIRGFSSAGPPAEYRIHQRDFAHLGDGAARRFFSAALPFDVTVTAYFRNATVSPKGPMVAAATEVIGGFFVAPRPPSPTNEENVPAVHVALRDKSAGSVRREILWGMSPEPLVVDLDGRRWALSLRQVRSPVPFAVRLEEFTRILHPGTSKPAEFKSDVVVVEGDVEQEIRISMNEPLRHRGYTFYQASFSESPGTGAFSSTLAVVRNPADKFPLWACCIVGGGMLVHFMVHLGRYLRRERKRRAV